ncbi:hypothetical protein HYQ46_010973 [Verticillium longisporum]|nr:hypothetical protein HYQ46_010973 [Verticillium longisporum]
MIRPGPEPSCDSTKSMTELREAPLDGRSNAERRAVNIAIVGHWAVQIVENTGNADTSRSRPDQQARIDGWFEQWQPLHNTVDILTVA